MILISALDTARNSVAAHPDRPATIILHDSPDLRLVAFRLAPGQEVKPHRSTSTVALHVLSGDGLLSGEADGGVREEPVAPGEVMVYEPNELHGMRATDIELLLLAVITPRPGSR